MAIDTTPVQVATGTYNQADGAPTSVSATWGSATTAGNTLIAVVGISLVAGGSSTYSAPSGWGTSVARVDNASNVGLEVWVIEDAASRSGTETFSIAGVARDSTLHLIEWSATGALIVDTVGADSTGTSTNPTTGGVAPSASQEILRLALLANRNNSTQSSPTNSFTEFNEVQSPNATAGNRVNTAPHRRVHTDGSSLSCQTTVGTSRPWAAVQLILIEDAGGTTVTGTGIAALTLTSTAAGQARKVGTATSNPSLTATSSGVRRTNGAGSATLAATGTAAGLRNTRGTASATLALGASATGVRRVSGTAIASLALTATASGSAETTVQGAGTAVLVLTATGSGVSRKVGSASSVISLTGSASGNPRKVGSAAALLTLTCTCNGTRRITAVGLASLTLAATASGTGSAPEQMVAVAALAPPDWIAGLDGPDQSASLAPGDWSATLSA